MKHISGHTTVTVSGGLVGNKSKIPIKTMAALATTISGEDVICLFHNAAHIEGTATTRIFLSKVQMMPNPGVSMGDCHDNLCVKCQNDSLDVFNVNTCPTMFDSNKGEPAPHIDPQPFSCEQFNDLRKVDITSVNPWCPPKAMKANECCSFCGEDSHTRDNCVKLYSFGCGFVPTNQLEPGTHNINFTKKSMTKIAPDFCCSESDVPLDF